MRALVIDGPRQAAVRDLPAPIPESDQLLVEVERVGICGTDVELYTGEMAYFAQGLTHFPLRLGHEWTGRVTTVGPGTDTSWIGRRVVGDTMLGCGSCHFCLNGKQHVCATRFEVGITDGWPGALAEQMLIPARFAHALPDRVPVGTAAMVEPAGNAYRAVQATGLQPRERLLIIGDGTIGLLAAQIALVFGYEVHLAGSRVGALELARRLGVTHVHSLAELKGAQPDRFGSVIDASSDETVPALSLRLVEPTGHAVWIGISTLPSTVDTRDLVLNDVIAVGILSASPALSATIALLSSGAFDPEPLVSEVIGLDDVASRLEGLRGEDAGSGPKVHVDPRC